MRSFDKKEFKFLIISIVVLAIVFGLDDKQPTFNAAYWLFNFIKVLIAVAFSLMLREFLRKQVASRYYCNTEYRLWNLYRYGFAPGAKFEKFKRLQFRGIPIGILLSLYFAILSFGKLYWAAVGVFDVSEDRAKRLGKRYTRLTEFELAIIALAGPMVNLFLALLFNILNQYTDFRIFVTINMWLSLFGFLPVSDLDGTKILAGSRSLYVFGLVFSIVSFILIAYLSIWVNLLLSLITALIIFIIYFYIGEYE